MSDESREFYTDILCTASELGAMSYWSEVTDTEYHDTGDVMTSYYLSTTVKDLVREEEGDFFYTVTWQDIRRVCNGVVKNREAYGVSERFQTLIREGMSEWYAGMIDSGHADSLFQLAAFGEIVYG